MSIRIGEIILNYKTNEKKYIVTYIGADYNEALDTYLNKIFNGIFPFYNSRKLEYSNVCGANAEFICQNLKIDGLKLGKIIITEWVERNHENLERIESLYGPIGITIGASYHALAYLEVIIEKTKYFVAVETTICETYKLQFYVGSNIDEFETIIKTRYQCSEFKISFDCKQSWMDIAYSGGRKRKMNTKRQKNKKTKKQKKTKRQKYIRFTHLKI